MKKSNYEFIVGADVSKATLDYTILRGKNRIAHTQIENSPKGLKKLESNLRKKNIRHCRNKNIKDVPLVQ